MTTHGAHIRRLASTTRQPGDRVEPPPADRDQLARHQPEHPQRARRSPCTWRRSGRRRSSRPASVTAAWGRSRGSSAGSPCVQREPEPQPQRQRQVHPDQHRDVGRLAEPPDRPPERGLDPEEEQHAGDDRQQRRQRRPGRPGWPARYDRVVSRTRSSTAPTAAASRPGSRPGRASWPRRHGPLLERGRDPRDDPAEQAEQADHLEPGDQAPDDALDRADAGSPKTYSHRRSSGTAGGHARQEPADQSSGTQSKADMMKSSSYIGSAYARSGTAVGYAAS